MSSNGPMQDDEFAVLDTLVESVRLVKAGLTVHSQASSNSPKLESKLKDHLACIEAARLAVSELSRELDSERTTTKHALGRIKNRSASIHRLPVETLSDIFIWGLSNVLQAGREAGDRTDYATRFLVRVTHVSSVFRQQALKTHRLWCIVHLEWKHVQLSGWLDRAGNVIPLELHFVRPRHRREEISVSEEALERISLLSSRWKAMDIADDPEVLKFLSFCEKHSRMQFTRLEFLRIAGQSREEHSVLHYFESQSLVPLVTETSSLPPLPNAVNNTMTPHLKALSLYNCDQFPTERVLTHVTNLTFSFLYFGYRHDLAEFISVLSYATNVEVVTIHDYGRRIWSPRQPLGQFEPFTLPRLCKLALGRQNRRTVIAAVLSAVRAPMLDDLSIWLPIYDDAAEAELADPLLHFLRESSLRSLSLAGSIHSIRFLLQLLSSPPSSTNITPLQHLRHLRIFRGHRRVKDDEQFVPRIHALLDVIEIARHGVLVYKPPKAETWGWEATKPRKRKSTRSIIAPIILDTLEVSEVFYRRSYEFESLSTRVVQVMSHPRHHYQKSVFYRPSHVNDASKDKPKSQYNDDSTMGESEISDDMSMSGYDLGDDLEPKRKRKDDRGRFYVPVRDRNEEDEDDDDEGSSYNSGW